MITPTQAEKAIQELGRLGEEKLTGFRADHVQFDRLIAVLKQYVAQGAEKSSE